MYSFFISVQFSSVAQSCPTHETQHARTPCPSPTPGVHSNWCLLSRWSHPAISFSPPPWQPQVWSLWVCSCFIDKFFCVTSQISHISDIIWYLSFSFWLTSLSMIISSCIHVAANHIISFFFSQTHMAPCGWPVMVWSRSLGTVVSC